MNIVLYSPENECVKIYTETETFEFKEKTEKAIDAVSDKSVVWIETLSLMSKTQLKSWLNLSSWFDKFKPISAIDAINMDIIFYDAKTQMVYLCDTVVGLEMINPKNSKRFSLLPESIAFVESAKLLTKKQFANWLVSGIEPEIKKTTPPSSSSAQYIHTKHDGTVLVEDIQIDGNPLRLNGKYHFVSVDSIGKDRLEASVNFKILQKYDKVEFVDEDYVQANKHKYKPHVSSATTLPVGDVKDFTTGEANDNIISIDL